MASRSPKGGKRHERRPEGGPTRPQTSMADFRASSKSERGDMPARPESSIADFRGQRSDSSVGATRQVSEARPESSAAEFNTPRMPSPSDDGSTLNPLQMAGRGSPQDGSGFSKVKGMRAVNTPTAPIHVDRRYFPRDMRGLLEIYEQGHTLQGEMAERCKDTTDAMEHLAGHCNDTVQVLMSEMHNVLLEIQEQAKQPANVVWDPVMVELAKIDRLQPDAIGTEVTKRLTQHQEAMLALENRMEEKMAARIDNIESAALSHNEAQRVQLDTLRQEVSQALSLTAGVGDVVRHIEADLTNLLGKQHLALKADVSQSLQDILRLQEKNRRADMASVESQMEERLTRMLGVHHETLKGKMADNIDELRKTQHDQAVEIAKIVPLVQTEMSAQFHNSRQAEQAPNEMLKEVHAIVRDDLSQMFYEIGTMQRAMNLEHAVKPRVGSKCTHSEKRFREQGMTTDIATTETKGNQTDDQYFKAQRKRNERKKQLAAKQMDLAQSDDPKMAAFYSKRRSGFGADEEKKKKMREALIKPSYNVANFYFQKGYAQQIARSGMFENLTFLVIAANAIWIAVDTDYNDAVLIVDAPLPFQIIEHMFCVYFSFELTVRFFAFRHKYNCVRDFWFVFDTVLVCGMVIETWVITIIILSVGGNSGSSAEGMGNVSMLRMTRLVKMLRMARMARLLRMVPELVVLVKSIGAALRSVVFFLVLTVIILYVFAVAFRQFTKDGPLGKEYFASVPQAMNSLLLDGMLPIYAPIVNIVASESLLYQPIMLVFILLASVTLMNMLIGVLVEVVRTVADREREAMAVIHVTNELREVMHDFLQSQEADRNSRVSKALTIEPVRSSAMQKKRQVLDFPDLTQDALVRFLSYPPVISLLRDCGVDAIAFLDSINFIFEELEQQGRSELPFVDFVQTVLNMRGTNPATVKDVKEQMRLMKMHNQEASRSTNALFVKTLQSFQNQMAMQLTELRKTIDSDFDEDEDEGVKFDGLGSFKPGLTGRGKGREDFTEEDRDWSGLSSHLAEADSPTNSSRQTSSATLHIPEASTQIAGGFHNIGVDHPHLVRHQHKESFEEEEDF